MSFENSAIGGTKEKERKSFSSLKSVWAVIIGAASFMVAGYWGLMIKDVLPQAIDATNKDGFSLVALGVWTLIGFFGVLIWVFGCIAARCHTVLYERWFK
ncbi:hypothetical protein [Microbulbifer celer]|uniref:Uncharacterized protein n=1 Tax=Microbulbifer celer TaxID=435905 RepID=A0ABW3UBH5_9GAMM|nr:hypothetical protein [Microbulbifer celer]UFN56843.1 hypothetical protein LPW13_14900 [Microbulbifer celer]